MDHTEKITGTSARLAALFCFCLLFNTVFAILTGIEILQAMRDYVLIVNR